MDISLKLKAKDELVAMIEKILHPDSRDKKGRSKLVRRGLLRLAKDRIRQVGKVAKITSVFAEAGKEHQAKRTGLKPTSKIGQKVAMALGHMMSKR